MESNASRDPGSSSPKAGRSYRSRRSRPCDKCRKGKQLCLIATEGQPCGGCIARKQQCTFDLPPLRRHRKLQSGSPELEQKMNISPVSGNTSAWVSTDPLLNLMDEGDHDQVTGGVGIAAPHSHLSSLQGWSRTAPDSSIPHTVDNHAALSAEPLPLPDSGYTSIGQDQTAFIDSDIWQTLFRPQSQPVETRPIPDPVSLDLDSGEGMESHFLGTGTFRGLTLREIDNATQCLPNQPGMVQFRQVSADDKNPVYFVRHPSLQYGQAPENGKAAWDKVTRLCAHLGNGTLTQALSILRRTFLHAFPIINYPQFEQACKGAEGAGPIPYSLLAATVAHSASYMPTLRPLHQQLWAHVINAMDAEFRQPRLMTLQLVILLLTSRPGVNFAQSDMTLSRATGAVHVLGLHIDPSHWSLPRWERSLRVRLFWTVLFHDKIRALLLGRPSHIHRDNYTTPMPTVDDARFVEDGEPVMISLDHQTSLETFVASCKLVPIIDRVLDSFMTLKAVREPISYLSRIALLGSIRADIDQIECSLSPEITGIGLLAQLDQRPTGVRSLQIMIFGLRVILHRIELDTVERSSSTHVLSIIYEAAMRTASESVTLIEKLTVADRLMFWMPYTFHHMSNIGSLLLRIASECLHKDPIMSDKAVSLASVLCSTLARYHLDEQWDMADETLKRLAEPAFTVGKECIKARDTYMIISNALGYHVSDTAWDDVTVTNHFGFINDGFDPSVWTVDGLPWFNV